MSSSLCAPSMGGDTKSSNEAATRHGMGRLGEAIRDARREYPGVGKRVSTSQNTTAGTSTYFVDGEKRLLISRMAVATKVTNDSRG